MIVSRGDDGAPKALVLWRWAHPLPATSCEIDGDTFKIGVRHAGGIDFIGRVVGDKLVGRAVLKKDGSDLGEVTGCEALAKLTKLERLWIGERTKVPPACLAAIRAASPLVVINTTETSGCAGTWRYAGADYVPRYALLREQFDYDNFEDAMSLFFNDPLYSKPKRG